MKFIRWYSFFFFKYWLKKSTDPERERLEDKYTLSSSSPSFDEAARRSELNTKTRMELSEIYTPGQKKVSQTPPDKLCRR